MIHFNQDVDIIGFLFCLLFFFAIIVCCICCIPEGAGRSAEQTRFRVKISVLSQIQGGGVSAASILRDSPSVDYQQN